MQLLDLCRLLAMEQQLMQIDSQEKQRQQLESQLQELDLEHEALNDALQKARGGNGPLKQEHSRVEAELRKLQSVHEQEDSAARQKVRGFCETKSYHVKSSTEVYSSCRWTISTDIWTSGNHCAAI